MRKRAAFTSLLWLILASLCLGVVSVANAAHLPVLMFNAYRDGGDSYGGDLYLYDLYHQYTLRLTSPSAQKFEHFAVMSPDGGQIALSTGGGTESQLGLMQIVERLQLGDEFVTLMNARTHQWNPPDWSPHIDGDTMLLAFAPNWDPNLKPSVALDFDIWVFDVPMRRWQPDDFLLAGNWDLILPIGDTILQSGRRLTDDDYYDYDIAWSPDGSQMAFVSNRDLNFEIYLLDTAGVNQNIRRITNHLAPDRHPTWSPDGQWLAFASEREGNSEIYIVSVNGGEPRRLTDNESRNLEPAWSPDGAYIVYLADGVITLIYPDGSGIQPLFQGSDVTWMP